MSTSSKNITQWGFPHERAEILNTLSNIWTGCSINSSSSVFTGITLVLNLGSPIFAFILTAIPSFINNSKAKRIVYVSCNPKTLKRDIELLINYNLTKIEGINMFNKTKHVETVCVLERK